MNHVLILGAPRSGKLRVVQIFTKIDSKLERPHSGLIYPATLKNKYFSVNFKLFVDEYGESSSSQPPEFQVNDWPQVPTGNDIESLESWKDQFLSEQMAELRTALDGIVFCIDPTTNQCLNHTMDNFSEIRDGLEDWDGFSLVVSTHANEDLEDMAIGYGFEYVCLTDKGTNIYKDKLGKDRILEVFETHEWKNLEKDNDDDDDDEYNVDQDQEEVGVAAHKQDKLKNMTEPLLNADPDELSTILAKLQVAREDIQKMNPGEREKYATKIMDEIMEFL